MSCAAIRAIADCNNRRALAQTSGPERLTRRAVLTIMTIFPRGLRLALRRTFPDLATYDLGNSRCAKCLNKRVYRRAGSDSDLRHRNQVSAKLRGDDDAYLEAPCGGDRKERRRRPLRKSESRGEGCESRL
jgi:hypothetical protein